MSEFQDKVVIVTGAAQGIGYSCASEFSRHGAEVILLDVDDKKGEASAKTLSATYMHCNVSSSKDIEKVIAAIVEKFGKIDVLINNAAIIHKASFLDLKEEDFDRVLGVNLKGALLMGQAVAKQMIKQNKAGYRGLNSIINMSSVNAVLAIPDIVPYVVSKGGINQLTKVMAISLAKDGIRTNAIGPGSINTEMLKVAMADDKARKTVLSRTPMGRPGEPSEIANVALFLAGKASSYVTGTCIYADGGRLGLNYTVAVDE